jgi:hypothetical protein
MSSLATIPDAPSANVVPINDSAALMAAVARAASDPSVDVDKMERLFAMHERMEARQAEQAFNTALAVAQSEMPQIVKDRRNEQTSSDYATLDAINRQIVPIYTRHGLALSFDTAESPLEDHVRVVCRVTHARGHSHTYKHDNPIDDAGIAGKVNKTPTHGRGSAITYARRYLTLLIFNLRTGYDDDGNGVGDTVDEATQRKEIHDEALSRHMDEVVAIKTAIKAEDWREMAEVWALIPEDDQRALWLATTKGGTFSTAERKAIKERQPPRNPPAS